MSSDLNHDSGIVDRPGTEDNPNNQWRDPDDYLEPVTGAPHSKLRIGQFRLSADCAHGEDVLDVYTIERRGGACTPGGD